jgi:hypothetical protein
MKLTYILALLFFLIAGCTPLGKKYNKLTVNQDIKDIKEYGASASDVALLKFYIDNKDFRKVEINPNTTYEDLLEQAKLSLIGWELNDIKIELKKIQEYALADSMRNIISIILISKDYNDTGFKEFLQMKFNIHNNSEKDIKAFKGDLVFRNVFGDVLKKFGIECDILIASHQAIMYDAQVKYDPYVDSDSKFLDAAVEDLQFKFDPKLILFDDGSKMQL